MKRLVLFCALISAPALAHDGVNDDWYGKLWQPDNPKASCCGTADAYWADKTVVRNGKVYAIITDTRPDGPLRRPHVPNGTEVEIPPNKMGAQDIAKLGNPTGHSVVFMTKERFVWCYVLNDGI